MLDSQREIKEQFQVTAVDLSLLSGMTVDSFECGNYHQTINPLMGINERLRIVGQSLDLCEPLNSTLSIGDKLLGQADYEALIKKQDEAIDEIKGRVAAQTARIVTITKEMESTNEALSSAKKELSSLKTEYDKLIENIGDADFKDILKKLVALENQTTTIINNLGEIGQNVLDLETFKTTQETINANQLMTNDQQKTKNEAQAVTNEDFEARIKALEQPKTGGTSNG